MALVKVPDFPLIPYQRTAQIGLSDLLFDAAGEKIAFVFRVEKTGSITDVIFRIGGVTTAQAVRVTLQTIDALNGLPSGTLYGGSTAGVLTAPTAGLLASVILGTPAAAVEGDIIAAVFEFNATVGNLNITYNSGISSSFPYCATFTTAWQKVNYVPMLSLKYSDATYSSPNTQQPVNLSNPSYAAASAPDEYALKFKTTFAGKITGFHIFLTSITSPTGTFDIVLYDTNGTTVLATKAVDPVILGFGNNSIINFTTPVLVPANAFLYAAVRATGTGNVGVRTYTVKEAGQLVSAGVTGFQSYRTDAGAWTDNTLAHMIIVPIYSEIETGAGTGTGLQSWGSGFF